MTTAVIPPQVSLTVRTVAELSAQNDLAYADASIAYVESAGPNPLWELVKTSVATVDNVTVAATASGSGRWLRIFSSSGGGGGGGGVGPTGPTGAYSETDVLWGVTGARELSHQAVVTTTNATKTTLYAITPPVSSTLKLWVDITSRNMSTGASWEATAANIVFITTAGGVVSVDGTIPAMTANVNGGGASLAMSAVIEIVAGQIVISVTGVAATTIKNVGVIQWVVVN